MLVKNVCFFLDPDVHACQVRKDKTFIASVTHLSTTFSVITFVSELIVFIF